MRKLDLGQTMTILANIGVIAGIVFLAYETRQNTIALKSETAQAVHDQIASIYAQLLTPSLQEIQIKAEENPLALTAVEKRIIDSFRDMTLQAWQNMFVQVREGAWDPELAEGWWQALRNSLEIPYYKSHYDESEHLLSAEFRQFVASDIMSRVPMQ